MFLEVPAKGSDTIEGENLSPGPTAVEFSFEDGASGTGKELLWALAVFSSWIVDQVHQGTGLPCAKIYDGWRTPFLLNPVGLPGRLQGFFPFLERHGWSDQSAPMNGDPRTILN